MKPFQTYEEQLQILESRGLVIENPQTALKILERENYYNLINGYKVPFLVRNGQEEVFITGTTFNEIYELYLFDRELRTVLLPRFLQFETTMKSRLAYRFSEFAPEPDAYLDRRNYKLRESQTQSILKLIPILYKIIGNELGKSNAIAHYLKKHDSVPLWVLVNFLTFGNVLNFFRCLQPKIQASIAKDFSLDFKDEYGKRNLQLTPEILESILKTVNFFRNVCAHEERLYNFKLFKPSKSSSIARVLELNSDMLSNGNTFAVVAFLKLVLPRENYDKLLVDLDDLFSRTQHKFNTVKFKVFLDEMGFSSDWFQQLTSTKH